MKIIIYLSHDFHIQFARFYAFACDNYVLIFSFEQIEMQIQNNI